MFEIFIFLSCVILILFILGNNQNTPTPKTKKQTRYTIDESQYDASSIVWTGDDIESRIDDIMEKKNAH